MNDQSIYDMQAPHVGHILRPFLGRSRGEAGRSYHINYLLRSLLFFENVLHLLCEVVIRFMRLRYFDLVSYPCVLLSEDVRGRLQQEIQTSLECRTTA